MPYRAFLLLRIGLERPVWYTIFTCTEPKYCTYVFLKSYFKKNVIIFKYRTTVNRMVKNMKTKNIRSFFKFFIKVQLLQCAATHIFFKKIVIPLPRTTEKELNKYRYGTDQYVECNICCWRFF